MHSPTQSEVLFSRSQFSISEVSDEILASSRNNYSALLRKMGEERLEAIGDKLHLHKANICRMKSNGELERVSAIIAALGFDFKQIEEELQELRRQNEALQVVAQANLSLHKEKPEVSGN